MRGLSVDTTAMIATRPSRSKYVAVARILSQQGHARHSNESLLCFLATKCPELTPNVRCFSGSHDSPEGKRQLFQEQMIQFQKERSEIFGDEESNSNNSLDTHPTVTTVPSTPEEQHRLFSEQMVQLQNEQTDLFGEDIRSTNTLISQTSTATSPEEYHRLFEDQMHQLKAEREELFGFTEEEESAWGQAGRQHKHDSSFMEEIDKARRLHQQVKEEAALSVAPTSNPFTHLDAGGTSVQMVDVGEKEVTQRRAMAEARVLLPSEVVEALGGDKAWNNPQKGPILETAKIAGIMAAKKTSDLIPLCHPLPLSKVQVTIDLTASANSTMTAIVRCDCRVSHTTGVEMEALTGATVAALTIYDMVKAISHNVRIQDTRLLMKSGGKTDVGVA